MASSDDELERARKIIFEKYATVTKTSRKTAKAMKLFGFLLVCISQSAEFAKQFDTRNRKAKQLETLGFGNEYVEKWRKIYQDEHPKPKIEILTLYM